MSAELRGPDRILLVEDDPRLATLVREYLEENAFRVEVESNGDRAVRRVLDERPQLVILDVMLPGLDGFEVCRRIRPAYDGPILILTARTDEIDEVVGLEIGADDYISKPVRPRVLLARVRSFLRRSVREEGEPAEPGAGEAHAQIQIGGLVIDQGRREVRYGDEEVRLTSAEFDLLWLLARNRGEVLTREQLFSDLRGIEYDGLDRSVDLRVSRIRKKMADVGPLGHLIKSVRGEGYLLVEDA
jgi:two-component system response regulator RstA